MEVRIEVVDELGLELGLEMVLEMEMEMEMGGKFSNVCKWEGPIITKHRTLQYIPLQLLSTNLLCLVTGGGKNKGEEEYWILKVKLINKFIEKQKTKKNKK